MTEPSLSDGATIRREAVAGLKWTTASNVLQRLLSIATMAILARHLEADVFGTFALAFVAIDSLQLLQGLGLNTALIQRPDLDQRTIHTAFTLVLGMGLAMFATTLLTAPLLATLLGDDAVAAPIAALGVTVLLGTASKIPDAVLWRQMRFDRLARIQLLEAVTYSALAIAFAIRSPTVWSLVYAYLGKRTVATLLTLGWSGYRPRLLVDRARARELLGFGRAMTVVAILAMFTTSLDAVVVGRLLGPGLLGHFTLAAGLGMLAQRQLTMLGNRVMLPVFAKLQARVDELEHAFSRAAQLIAVVAFPVSMLFVCLAEPIVLTLYGDRWRPVIGLLQLMGVAGLHVPFTSCLPALFRGCGRPEAELRLLALSVIVRAAFLVALTQAWGLIGAASAGLASALVVVPLSLYMTRKLIGLDYRRFLKRFVPVAAATAIMGLSISLLRLLHAAGPFALVGNSPIATLVVIGGLGLGTYLAALLVLDRPLVEGILSLARGQTGQAI